MMFIITCLDPIVHIAVIYYISRDYLNEKKIIKDIQSNLRKFFNKCAVTGLGPLL